MANRHTRSTVTISKKQNILFNHFKKVFTPQVYQESLILLMLLDYIFNLNLIILASDHLITGGLALFFPKVAIRFYKIAFGANV